MRLVWALLAAFTLTACGGVRDDLVETPEPIGNFLLGHNVAVVNDPQRGPFSRPAENEEWQEAMRSAVADRFNETRFFGDTYYHIGVAVEGYVLAYPGVPLVYSPKSILIFSVNFFEDSTQSVLHDEAIRITVFEPCCAVPFVGTGFTRSAEEQMEGLTFNAARAIERKMRENAHWFGGVAEEVPADETILDGNVLIDNPELVAPEQDVPEGVVLAEYGP